MIKNVELLAPAGNYETMLGAFNAGADAVYLGGQGFGARAFADNFTNEEVIRAIRYAHLHGKKIYLTVNTLLKENEVSSFKEFFAPFAYAGLDGAIIQDFGIFRIIREAYPWVELHVSTQMTITGEKGAKLLMDLGASRIVPARELSISEIRSIHDNCRFADGKSIEIEAFIHGAMCYCYSGACLFSSMIGERSGNRGRCAQPCRLPYRPDNKGECYPLSLKDMCMVDRIPELIEAGIDSFKIEGRMKKPEYAAGVTSIYRKYIDRYYDLASKDSDFKEGAIKLSASKDDKRILSSLYLRSKIGEGYYFRHNSPDMITLDNPAYNGSDERVLEEVRNRYITGEKKIDIEISCKLRINEPASLTVKTAYPLVSDEVISTSVTGDTVQEAVNRAMSEEDIEKQLGKFGNTGFSVSSIVIDMDDKGIFIPNKALNELRRNASIALENEIIKRRGYNIDNGLKADSDIQNNNKKEISQSVRYGENTQIAVSVMDYAQLQSVCDYFIKNEMTGRIYIDSRILLLNESIPEHTDCDLYVSLPYILRNETFFDGHKEIKAILEKANVLKLKGVLVRNAEELRIIKETEYKGDIILDYGLYIWNHEALKLYEECAAGLNLKGFNLPLELNSYEMSELLEACCFNNVESFTYATGMQIYGRVPMMHTANCLKNTLDNCSGNKGKVCNYGCTDITDRTGRKLPVTYDCTHCANIIWNSVPVSLFKKTKKLKGMADKSNLLYRIDFTIEKSSDVHDVLDAYTTVLYSKDKDKIKKAENVLAAKQYTAGHFERSAD